MRLDEFCYELPKELIAQLPSEKRDNSSLMLLDRQKQSIQHKKFFNIIEYLSENDVLIMNNTRVIPARLIGKKTTGAEIEVFLLERHDDKVWSALVKPAKRVKKNTEIFFSDLLKARVINRENDEKWLVELIYKGNFEEILEKTGNIPLPPYIERNLSDKEIKRLDFERYQTVYARNPGSVAAPTAGLHFTGEILDKLKQKNIKTCTVSLNVGLGTFKPVRVENILEHKMDREFYEVPQATADTVKKAKKAGKNIVAVGTTTVRTLETAFKKGLESPLLSGWSELFIYPGYELKVVDKLITNFHLPESTLLMLVCAFAGKDFTFQAYKEAIEKKYRFYSYGDCMFIF